MKRWIAAFAASCMAATLVLGRPALAETNHSFVNFENQSDAYVYVSTYTKNCISGTCHPIPYGASWCVAPRETGKRGYYPPLWQVRVEVSRSGCRSKPILLNQVRDFPGVDDQRQTSTMTYVITGTDGHYVYGNR